MRIIIICSPSNISSPHSKAACERAVVLAEVVVVQVVGVATVRAAVPVSVAARAATISQLIN